MHMYTETWQVEQSVINVPKLMPADIAKEATNSFRSIQAKQLITRILANVFRDYQIGSVKSGKIQTRAKNTSTRAFDAIKLAHAS